MDDILFLVVELDRYARNEPGSLTIVNRSGKAPTLIPLLWRTYRSARMRRPAQHRPRPLRPMQARSFEPSHWRAGACRARSPGCLGSPAAEADPAAFEFRP